MPGIFFAVKKPAEPESWLETKGDTYWTDNANLDWDAANDRYDTLIAEGSQTHLDATSAWADWRGAQINFTFANTTNTITIIVRDTDGNAIGQVNSTWLLGGGTIHVPLTFTTFDVGRVDINTGGSPDWIEYWLTSINAYSGDSPAPEIWTEHWDDSDFESYYGSWSGSSWPSTEDAYYPDDEIVELDVIGTWYEYYRPSKVRITYTGGEATQTMTLSVAGGEAPIASGDYASGAEIDIDWDNLRTGVTKDLLFVLVFNENNNPFSITKIEWLE